MEFTVVFFEGANVFVVKTPSDSVELSASVELTGSVELSGSVELTGSVELSDDVELSGCWKPVCWFSERTA